MKAYKDLESPAFNDHVYRVMEDYSYWALEWVRERGINLRGFTMEVKGERQSGPVLVEVMRYINFVTEIPAIEI